MAELSRYTGKNVSLASACKVLKCLVVKHLNAYWHENRRTHALVGAQKKTHNTHLYEFCQTRLISATQRSGWNRWLVMTELSPYTGKRVSLASDCRVLRCLVFQNELLVAISWVNICAKLKWSVLAVRLSCTAVQQRGGQSEEWIRILAKRAARHESLMDGKRWHALLGTHCVILINLVYVEIQQRRKLSRSMCWAESAGQTMSKFPLFYSDGQSLRTLFFPTIISLQLEPRHFSCLTQNWSLFFLNLPRSSNCTFLGGSNCKVSYIYFFDRYRYIYDSVSLGYAENWWWGTIKMLNTHQTMHICTKSYSFNPPPWKKQSAKKHIYQKLQKRFNQYSFKGNLERRNKQQKPRFTKATKTLPINSFWKEFGKEKTSTV